MDYSEIIKEVFNEANSQIKIETTGEYVNAIKMIANEINGIAEIITNEIDDLYWNKTGILHPINEAAYENARNNTIKTIEERTEKVKRVSQMAKGFMETGRGMINYIKREFITTYAIYVNASTDKVEKSVHEYTETLPLVPPINTYTDLYKTAVHSFNFAAEPLGVMANAPEF